MNWFPGPPAAPPPPRLSPATYYSALLHLKTLRKLLRAVLLISDHFISGLNETVVEAQEEGL